MGCEVKDLLSYDLSLYDTQEGVLAGPTQEYVFSSRLDNLASCFVSLEALSRYTSTSAPQFPADGDISMIVLFDHEEVGSGSLVGAASPLLPHTMNRIQRSLSILEPSEEDDFLAISRSNSMMISLDMAHGLHPNYSSRHDPSHAPILNGGLVLKENSNQR